MDDQVTIEAVNASLELCAERAGDIVPAVFERFFALCAEAAELMRHTDRHIQGRMFEAVLDLLMSDAHLGADGYLAWELQNHIDAYAATPPMYAAFFEAIIDVVRDALGRDWNDAFAEAWEARTQRIMSDVHAYG